MLEIGRGKGKGHTAVPVRSAFCDKFSAFFITEEKSRDKHLNKHPCYITKTASGETGVITTVQNTCLEFQQISECTRGK